MNRWKLKVIRATIIIYNIFEVVNWMTWWRMIIWGDFSVCYVIRKQGRTDQFKKYINIDSIRKKDFQFILRVCHNMSLIKYLFASFSKVRNDSFLFKLTSKIFFYLVYILYCTWSEVVSCRFFVIFYRDSRHC